jgi:predicted acyl esterase
MIQPWHPFTRASATPLAPGQPTLLQVEIFPTNAEIEAGHRLRVSIGPSDFPHLLAPLPQLLQTILGRVKVLHDPAHASSVEIPVLFPCSAEHPCEDKPVPNLRRGG